MEADVALHSPETWASTGEQRSDKIKYVYNNRRKEREARSARKASRLQQIKPSRSYDNDLEASVKKESGLGQSQLSAKTKDDSSLRYGEQSSVPRQQGRSRDFGYSGIPTSTGSPCASRKTHHALAGGGSSEARGKPKENKKFAKGRKHISGYESPRLADKQNSLPERTGRKSQIQPPKSLKMAKSEDKLPVRSGLSPSSPPQSIVLEVKDGPSIRYKPSQTMLCDTSELDSCGVVKNAPYKDFSNTNSGTECKTRLPLSDQTESSTDHSRPECSARVCPDERPLPALQKGKEAPEPDNLGFYNVTEVSQKRYGVKHDDIVVGPSAYRELDSLERPCELPTYGQPSTVSDEAAFSSVSLTSQLKAGINHDDIVVGPNANRRKVKVQNKDTQSKTSPGLPPIPHPFSKSGKSDQSSPSGEDKSDKNETSETRHDHFSKLSSAKVAASSTLERETRIPKLSERVSEQRQRGASPSSGIPVFRQGRPRDKSQDSPRTLSPTVNDITRPPLRTPLAMEDEIKADRNYGSVDRVRWRPKTSKSGLCRMKHGAKREANVSTESGYATDQMPCSDSNESKFSPQRGLDTKSRFHRISGSCNDIDKDLEEMFLDSRPVNTCEVNKDSLPAKYDSKVSKSKQKSKISQKQGLKLKKGAMATACDETHRQHSDPALPSGDYHSLPAPSSASKESLPSEGPIPQFGSSFCKQKSVGSQPHHPPLSILPSQPDFPSPYSVTTFVAETPPVVIPSTAAPMKPRLHRSAEHLFGHTKLSVFRSTDDERYQPDNASDISSSTSSSSKTSKSQPDSNRQRQKSHAKKLEALATPKRSGTPIKGRSVSMLRKESERSVAIVRRGSDRAIPVSRHDPSVQDLKAATSLKELCQSMASLLNIDNEKAAEMLSTSLSKRRDLVEGLDADAILDYLTHHGVLHPSVLVNLKGQKDGDIPTTIQRNSAILKHVEELGDTAVALFINALRQSGQLHLASSLDTEQRIKPMAGEGYLDKPRHKGEIVVRLSVEALKILAPREPPSERNVNLHLLTSPYGDQNSDMMDSDEDQVKPKSCWCFCVSRKRRNRSSSSKKEKKINAKRSLESNYEDAVQTTYTTQIQQYGVDPAVFDVQTYTPVPSGRNFDKTNTTGSKISTPFSPSSHHSSSYQSGSLPVKEKKKSKSKTKTSGKPYVPGTAEDPKSLSSMPDHVSVSPCQEDKSTESKAKKSSKQSKKKTKEIPTDLNLSSSSDKKKRAKDAADGIFMEYDSHLELVKLRACHDELASPTRQAGPVGIMVEQWKSSGKHFLIKSDLLCRAIVEEFLTDIIKYFEQDRGTLVLDVVSEATSVTVFNICMTKHQVAKLEKDHLDGVLLEKLQEVFLSRLDITKFDIRGVHFCTEVDGNQLKSVLSELS